MLVYSMPTMSIVTFPSMLSFCRMAKYYTKIMEKVDGTGNGFIDSEIERIGRMLGKSFLYLQNQGALDFGGRGDCIHGQLKTKTRYM